MQKPFGTWPSAITAEAVARQGLRLSHVSIDGDTVYWLEGRAVEDGCNVLVQHHRGATVDLTPPGFDVRTRVHEYGGGSYVVSDGTVCLSNFADQRLYRLGTRDSSRIQPVPITPPGRWCYADGVIDRRRARVIVVREDRTDSRREPVNSLVAIDLEGGEHAGRVLTSGYDFYSTPRLSLDGSRLAWLAWRHPQMPWDGTELWVGELDPTGALVNPVHVAGGPNESIYQPGWAPDGALCFASDRDGWWRLYSTYPGGVAPVLDDPPAEAEFGRPQWLFGTATWAPAGADRLVVSFTQAGRWRLATIDLRARTLVPIAEGLEPLEWLVADSTHALLVAGSATTSHRVVRVDLETGRVRTLRSASDADVDPAEISRSEPIEFPTSNGQRAYAFYYPPKHARCAAPSDERPPLILVSHGGPTLGATATLDMKTQFWTNRGFAVVDVNYGGSSGFGRAYRRRLDGQWGVVDVDDMVQAARYLVEQGKADPDRLVIRGGSAGGYTTLAALTFRPGVFTAGASYYGVSDIEALARDTHKFESRYLDHLVGPYPEARDLYRARSPIHFVDDLACPVILFQGLEDTVVPPSQSEKMVAALSAKGLPVAYLSFEGEQHGFRRAATIARCLEAELYFYGVVFGFTPADRLEPVAIAGIPRAGNDERHGPAV
jgi:dipeptidyl aminopeptidase/acylaminoacyl peptidase